MLQLSFLEGIKDKPEESNLRQRKAQPSDKPKIEEEDKPARPFTAEQVEGIKRLSKFKQKGDLYGVLGLEKGCSDAEIKKAYRKLALQFHPDKCGAPGTDDAFKGNSKKE